MMSIHIVLVIAGCIFGFVALMHLLRVIYKVDVRIGRTDIPQWVSVLGFGVAVLLSIGMFVANTGLYTI